MDLDVAFAQLFGAFPEKAVFQGTHFKYATRNGTILIERRGFDATRNTPVYYYWLLVGDRFKLVHSSQKSRLSPMEPINRDTFTPSSHESD